MDNSQNGSSNRKPLGCGLGCLAAFFGTFLIGYLIIFHSPLPVKAVTNLMVKGLQTSGTDVQVKGVGGSLAGGITFKELIIPGEAGDTTIKGFKFRYKGITKWSQGQVVIKELSTESAEFVLANDAFKVDASEDGISISSSTATQGVHTAQSTVATNINLNGFFALQNMNLRNIRIRTEDGSVDLQIPLIRLSGLHISGNSFQLAELEVVSDFIEVHLVDGTTHSIDGQAVTYDRKITGVIQPGIHKTVKAPIDFSLEMAANNGRGLVRMVLLDGAMEIAELPGDVTYVRFKDMSIGDYANDTENILPGKLTFTAREKDKRVKIGDGGFEIGKTQFTIHAQEIDADDPEARLVAEATVAGQTIKALLNPDRQSNWPPIDVSIAAQAGMNRQELLALVYYQKRYNVLDANEKARIDLLDDQK